MSLENSYLCTVRFFRGRVPNFNQSEGREQYFLASDWLKSETLPRNYRALLFELLSRCLDKVKQWPRGAEY